MNQVYKVKKEDLIGQLEGYPIQVVQKLVEMSDFPCSSNTIKTFQINGPSSEMQKRFPEEFTFWREIIFNKNFDLFFKNFPELKNIENEEKIDTHVYYRGNYERCEEVIAELEKLGGINKFGLSGSRLEGYYYINPLNKDIVFTKDIDTKDLLESIYKEKFLSDIQKETILIDGKQYDKKGSIRQDKRFKRNRR